MTDQHAAIEHATEQTTPQPVAQGNWEDGVMVLACPAEVNPGWAERRVGAARPFGPVLFPLMAFLTLRDAAAGGGLWLLASVGGASLVSLIGSLRSRLKVRRIARVSQRTVTIEGLGSVRAEELLRVGHTETTGSAGVLTLVRRRGPSITLGLQDARDGARFVRAMGLGVAETRSVWRGASWPARPALLVGLSSWVGLHLSARLEAFAPPALLSAFAGTLLAAVAWRATALDVEVGSDGVFLRGPLRSQFVSYRALRAVGVPAAWRFVSRVVLTLESGRQLSVFVGDDQRDDLRRTLDQALAAHHDREEHAAHGALARGGQSILEWLVALRRLGSGAQADYRVPPLAPETLLRMASDPGEAPTHRAAAAVVFATAASTSERSKLAVVARAIAHPALRKVVFSAARDDTPAQLAVALRAVAEEEAARRSPSSLRKAPCIPGS